MFGFCDSIEGAGHDRNVIGNGEVLYECFQKIGFLPPNHAFVHRVWNHYKPSILGVFPLFLETPI